jgi:membrane dipeptidase
MKMISNSPTTNSAPKIFLALMAFLLLQIVASVWILIRFLKQGQSGIWKIICFCIIPLSLSISFTLDWAGREIDPMLNAIGREDVKLEISDEAYKLHQELFVIDFHSDSLLWKRDLLQKASHSHVDIPRLIEGNVAIELFGIVTKIPRELNFDKNSNSSTDLISVIALVQQWPNQTWGKLLPRALYLADKLDKFDKESNGKFRVLHSKKDLDEYLNIWNYLKQHHLPLNVTAGLLGVEGAQALDGNISNVEVLYNAGVRYMGLAHFFDNEICGSAHGETKYGLTELGKQVVREMERLGMLVDVAHVSEATVDDVLKIATKPVISSHTGIRSICPGPRNLKDEHLVSIAKTGGLVNIGFFKGAQCELTLKAILDSIDYVVKLIGVDYVGLGSDFDGAVKTPFDVTGLVELTQGLLLRGYKANDIANIMGGNGLNLLKQILH